MDKVGIALTVARPARAAATKLDLIVWETREFSVYSERAANTEGRATRNGMLSSRVGKHRVQDNDWMQRRTGSSTE